MTSGIQLQVEAILPALTEAITYSLQVMRESGDPEPSSLGRVLRTDELREAALQVFPAIGISPVVGVESHREFDATMSQQFSRFSAMRRDVIRSVDPESRSMLDMARNELLRNGAIVYSMWCGSTLDCLAQRDSHGYVDEQCVPPWSTWLAIEHIPGGYYPGMVSWVPPEARDLVQDGMWIDPLDAMNWVYVDDGILALRESGYDVGDAV